MTPVLVKHLMTAPVVTFFAEQSLPLAEDVMQLKHVRHLPVIDETRRLVGLVSHRDQLTREVVKLRLAFDAHNKFEEQLLRPVLLEEDAFAAVRIDRMVEDHVGEHRAMRAQLNTTETGALRETLEMLRAHLAAEERYLLNARVLRDDLINLEGSS